MTSSPRPPHLRDRPDPIGGTTALGGKSAPARGYLLDNARAEAGERFAWLAELFDAVTRGHVDRLGGQGWLALLGSGAGGRSIPEALAATVGPTGHVLATDIDPSWLKAGDGYEVRQHDVAADPPPRCPGRSIWCTPGSCWSMYPIGLGRWPRWWQRSGLAAGCWSRTPIPLCSHWRAWTTTALRSGGPTGCATRSGSC
jgi:hypothetical protein